jgi:hypothetical protein
MKSICIISTFLLLISCSKKEKSLNCSESLIEMLEKEPVRNPPAKLYEWKVDDKTYYYITPFCCDQFSSLYDSTCSHVCAPDGGFSGKGDGSCPKFNGSVSSKLLWEDTRK